MKTVNIKLSGLNPKMRPILVVNGETVQCKKNEFGSYDAVYQTDKEEAIIEVYRNLELTNRLWWLYAIISFLISVFGLLNPWYDRKCIDLQCKYIVRLKEKNDVNIKFYALSTQGKASEIETALECFEVKNEYFVNKTAKKRRRWYQIIKAVCLIALVVVMVVIIV